MTAKERLADLIERSRNGEVLSNPELKKELDLATQDSLFLVRQCQLDNEGVVPNQLMSTCNKLLNARDRWELYHKGEGGTRLSKGTYGSIFEDSDGDPVELRYEDETPEA